MQKFLILGCERSGTHRVTDFIYKNLKIKFKIKNIKKNKNIYTGLLKEDNFLKKKKFYIFNPLLKKKYTTIQKKILLKKKVLLTHKIYDNIFFDFRDYNLILTIRDPISVINSTIMYVTKKSTMSYNKQYKIKSPLVLSSKKKIINNYIKGYYKFYKKILSFRNRSIFRNIVIIEYKDDLSKKFKQFGFKNYFTTIPKLHSTKKNSEVDRVLKKNFNFDNCYKLYKSIKKINLK